MKMLSTYVYIASCMPSSLHTVYLQWKTSINDHLKRATTRYKTALNSGPDWSYNDFNVKQPLRNGHLSTPYNEQLQSALEITSQNEQPHLESAENYYEIALFWRNSW